MLTPQHCSGWWGGVMPRPARYLRADMETDTAHSCSTARVKLSSRFMIVSFWILSMIEMSCQRVGVRLKFNPCLQVSILVYDLMEQWTVAGKGLLHFIIDIQSRYALLGSNPGSDKMHSACQVSMSGRQWWNSLITMTNWVSLDWTYLVMMMYDVEMLLPLE